jgi:integrase
VFASNEAPTRGREHAQPPVQPLLKRLGLPWIRRYDFRHTYAPLLLACGTHPTYGQKSLGHSSAQLTLDRYSHWMPSVGRNTAEGIDEALG